MDILNVSRVDKAGQGRMSGSLSFVKCWAGQGRLAVDDRTGTAGGQEDKLCGERRTLEWALLAVQFPGPGEELVKRRRQFGT